jgi:hypothetical protein
MLLSCATPHLAGPSSSLVLPEEVIVVPKGLVSDYQLYLSKSASTGTSAIRSGTRIHAAVSLDRRSNCLARD